MLSSLSVKSSLGNEPVSQCVHVVHVIGSVVDLLQEVFQLLDENALLESLKKNKMITTNVMVHLKNKNTYPGNESNISGAFIIIFANLSNKMQMFWLVITSLGYRAAKRHGIYERNAGDFIGSDGSADSFV